MSHSPAESFAPRCPLHSHGSPPHPTQARIQALHRLLASVFLPLCWATRCEDVLLFFFPSLDSTSSLRLGLPSLTFHSARLSLCFSLCPLALDGKVKKYRRTQFGLSCLHFKAQRLGQKANDSVIHESLREAASVLSVKTFFSFFFFLFSGATP